MWWLCSSRVLRGQLPAISAPTISLMVKPPPKGRDLSTEQRSLKLHLFESESGLDGGEFAVFLVGVLTALAVAVEVARQHRLQRGRRDPELREARAGAARHIVGLQQDQLVGGDRGRQGRAGEAR